jgi:hypothetical protein
MSLSKRISYNLRLTGGSFLSDTLNVSIATVNNMLSTNISSGDIRVTGNLFVGGTVTTVNITSTNLVDTNISCGSIVTTSLMALGNSNTIGSIVTTGGNVGFGTSSPSDLIHLYTASVGANVGQVFQTGSRQYRMGIRGDISNSFVIQDDTAAQAYFAIDTTGNLTVKGDVIGFESISDRRFKENIQSIASDFALDKVKNLRPVTFTWKSNISNLSKIGTEDVGFIAQEVEELLEYVVDEFSDLESGEVYKKIKHERIIPYLVGAIQKLEIDNKTNAVQLKETREQLRETREQLQKLQITITNNN